MASNGAGPRASSIASSSENSFVEASGYKFSEKDRKPQKMKLKKTASKPTKGSNGKSQDNDADSIPDSQGSSSPVLPEMDEKIMEPFPNGKPSHDQIVNETVLCKHCKRPFLKSSITEHIKSCLRTKQEKARKKKEARDAKNKEKAAEKEEEKAEDTAGGVKGEDDGDSKEKSAKKSAVKASGDDGPKKSKKRKADEEGDKEPKKKKKKDNEPKPKVPKPKGPVDVERQCGVTLPNGAQCARSLTCKSHSMGAKRAVPGRSLPYDALLQAYQKKNQARQQKAAIDANAPLQDDQEGGPVDSDEEKDAVMAAIARSRPRPLETHVLIPTRRKYQLVRMKEMLSNALGGSRGGTLFSAAAETNRGYFPTSADSNSTFAPPTSAGEVSAQGAERRQSLMQQAQNRAMQSGAIPTSRKSSVSAAVGQ